MTPFERARLFRPRIRRFPSEMSSRYRDAVNSLRARVMQAKHALEIAERQLEGARVMSDRLKRMPEATPDDEGRLALRDSLSRLVRTLEVETTPDRFQPAVDAALAGLQRALPGLTREFDQRFDLLRSLTFLKGLDTNHIETRSFSDHRDPHRHKKSPR